ncbi:hypothetical protein RB213_000156 [Colletotrichum asianum]
MPLCFHLANIFHNPPHHQPEILAIALAPLSLSLSLCLSPAESALRPCHPYLTIASRASPQISHPGIPRLQLSQEPPPAYPTRPQQSLSLRPTTYYFDL